MFALSPGSTAITAARRALGLAVLTMLMAALSADRADAWVYWTDRDAGAVVRARTDGGGVDKKFIRNVSAFGIAVDARHVYWSDREGNVGRAKLNGRKPDRHFLKVAGSPHGIAVDDGHLYWADPNAGSVGRANLDGSGIDPSFITGANGTRHVAARDGRVYWTNSGGIGRADADGSDVEPGFLNVPAGGVGVDAGHVYWSYFGYSRNRGGIGRARLDGSDVERHFIREKRIYPSGVAVNDARIFWEQQNVIGRANLDGTRVRPNLIHALRLGHGDNGIGDVATDADGTPPETQITKHPPRKTRHGAVSFRFKASEQGSRFQCKLDRAHWRRCSTPDSVEDLDAGEHKFRVRAIDGFGNVDPTPAKALFEVVG